MMAKLNFAKKNEKKVPKKETWKVLISDDEEDIHHLTKTVLKDFIYKNRSLEFISAYTGEDTVNILKTQKDVVLVLLDVIMESDDAGLQVVKKIRDDLKNDVIQIILRTGQPGVAPEHKVVMEYAINDYKEKTELTSNKLVTSITTAIRAYENIKKAEKLNHELTSLTTVFDEYVIASKTDSKGAITYASKAFEEISGYSNKELIDNNHRIVKHEDTSKELHQELWETISTGKIWRGEIQDRKKDGTPYWLYTIIKPEHDIDGKFLYYTAISQDITAQKDMEKANIEIANLNIEIEDTQKEVVFRLGSIAESRSKETGLHVKRVAEYSRILATQYGLSEEEVKELVHASPMHDIGKVAIPDSILNKPGKLTEEEFEIMKTHAKLGYEMLKTSNKKILKAAAIVAHEHQEKFDGSGYPQGLFGENIHIYGRITALADVFDALSSPRVYKKPWSDQEIFDFIKKEKAKHFDPILVDIFFNNIDELLKIKATFKDEITEEV